MNVIAKHLAQTQDTEKTPKTVVKGIGFHKYSYQGYIGLDKNFLKNIHGLSYQQYINFLSGSTTKIYTTNYKKVKPHSNYKNDKRSINCSFNFMYLFNHQTTFYLMDIQGYL